MGDSFGDAMKSFWMLTTHLTTLYENPKAERDDNAKQ